MEFWRRGIKMERHDALAGHNWYGLGVTTNSTDAVRLVGMHGFCSRYTIGTVVLIQ